MPNVRALEPRFGGLSLFYLSSLGADDGLWRLRDGQATEVWKGADDALLETPAVSLDGGRVAIVLRRGGKHQLHVLFRRRRTPAHGGGNCRPGFELLVAGWQMDRHWRQRRHPSRAFQDSVGGRTASSLGQRAGTQSSLVAGWKHDRYAGTNVSIFAPLLAVRPDGASVELPHINLRRLGELLA